MPLSKKDRIMTLQSPPSVRMSSLTEPNRPATERIISLTAGALLITNGLRQGGLKGWLQLLVGVGAACWGCSRDCSQKQARGHAALRSISIDRPRAEVFAFCREPMNIGALIPWVESIEEVAEHSYRWTAFGKLGRPVHWTLVQERTEENRLLRWSTRFHGPWQHDVQIHFIDSPGHPGTELKVVIASQKTQRRPDPEPTSALSTFSDKALANVLSRVKQHLENADIDPDVPAIANTPDLTAVYRNYIACLNAQDWSTLGEFVGEDVYYNDQRIGLSGYREMLERDFSQIPDLHFDIQLLTADTSYIASRLAFDCTPKGLFLGLPVNGKKVHFTENVFYQFREGKIERVWSVIDKAAIEGQI
jgi:steroid delta-isomerase-like uncharacterized protein